ncbi:hypothetical protein AX774_g6521 [Zancudomyces culisetae]|uniref:Uncharacterized protein n=1 Tax=Zancudomyces culisetae TaxID=1213189 RepID=A0A1R1PGH5_ZANCU|nr:hypothetical protein AX774_g6521 [Zancudomyces culisetae]|eukprot:OMH80047.1 hypothetical protein AX774_g6521 [Zancudomyces culisetae]
MHICWRNNIFDSLIALSNSVITTGTRLSASRTARTFSESSRESSDISLDSSSAASIFARHPKSPNSSSALSINVSSNSKSSAVCWFSCPSSIS